MNILLLSQFFSSTRGGGEYVFSLIAKKLVENNHKVWIISNKIKGEVYTKIPNLNLVFVSPTLEYKGGLPPKLSDNISYTMNTIIKGLKIIKKEKIDLIHSNNFSPALSGSILSSLTSRPHVTTIHDVFSLSGEDFWKKWSKQNDVSKITAFLGPIFEKLIKDLRHDCVHTVSEASKDDLVKLGIKKPIYIIPNAIEYFESPTTEIDKYQFIYVGRLVFYKNLELVINAIDIVIKKEDKIRLIIVGNGPHKKSLEDLVQKLGLKDHVKFKGYVSTKEKMKLISESNALVFPSLFEGFGLVILEAFSQKRPVLVSDVRPLSDIVSKNQSGFILDPQNKDKWADVLLDLIKNPEVGNKIGAFGFKELEKYSSQKMYEKILQMYNNVIKK